MVQEPVGKFKRIDIKNLDSHQLYSSGEQDEFLIVCVRYVIEFWSPYTTTQFNYEWKEGLRSIYERPLTDLLAWHW